MEKTVETSVIAVIGAGAMGSGIAQVAATSGFKVKLSDVSAAVLEKALALDREKSCAPREGRDAHRGADRRRALADYGDDRPGRSRAGGAGSHRGGSGGSGAQAGGFPLDRRGGARERPAPFQHLRALDRRARLGDESEGSRRGDALVQPAALDEADRDRPRGGDVGRDRRGGRGALPPDGKRDGRLPRRPRLHHVAGAGGAPPGVFPDRRGGDRYAEGHRHGDSPRPQLSDGPLRARGLRRARRSRRRRTRNGRGARPPLLAAAPPPSQVEKGHLGRKTGKGFYDHG